MSTAPRRDPDGLIGRWDARTSHVHLMRRIILDDDDPASSRTEIVSNVLQQIWLWPDVYYGWGPERAPGYTLAVNILDRLLAPPIDAECDDWHIPVPTCRDALYLACPFQVRWLVPLPSMGGRLAGHELREWLRIWLRRLHRRGVDLATPEPTSLYPNYP